MTGKHYLLIAATLLLFVHSACLASVDEKDPKLVALFIYKFTEHITWPSTSEKMQVGIVGAPEVLAELKKLEASRPRISVTEVSSVAEASGLHVLFLCSEAKPQYRTYTKGLSKQSTLLICEDKSDWRLGIDIAFLEVNDRLSYFLDQGHLERRGLVASRRLLGLGG